MGLEMEMGWEGKWVGREMGWGVIWVFGREMGWRWVGKGNGFGVGDELQKKMGLGRENRFGVEIGRVLGLGIEICCGGIWVLGRVVRGGNCIWGGRWVGEGDGRLMRCWRESDWID